MKRGVCLYVDEELLEWSDAEAKRRGMNRSQFFTIAIEELQSGEWLRQSLLAELDARLAVHLNKMDEHFAELRAWTLRQIRDTEVKHHPELTL